MAHPRARPQRRLVRVAESDPIQVPPLCTGRPPCAVRNGTAAGAAAYDAVLQSSATPRKPQKTLSFSGEQRRFTRKM